MATKFNLLVIRSSDIEAAARFYGLLGLTFCRHSHGQGPEHFASENSGIVFEIYPQRDGKPATNGTRLGFQVDAVDAVLDQLVSSGGRLISAPQESPWGRRAVVEDLDGRRVEVLSTQADGPGEESNSDAI